MRTTSKEIYDMFNEPKINDVVIVKILQRLGHIEKMSDERVTK